MLCILKQNLKSKTAADAETKALAKKAEEYARALEYVDRRSKSKAEKLKVAKIFQERQKKKKERA